MSRSDQHEIVIVPERYGMEPSDTYEVIAVVLHGLGGRATEHGTFRLDVHAVNHLRRQGITIRNRRALSVTFDTATRNRDLLVELRSRVDRNRASVATRVEHANARETMARDVLARFAQASAP